jgi:hypothetical protein
MDAMRREKPFLLPGIEPRFLGRPVRILVAIATELGNVRTRTKHVVTLAN